MKAFSRKENTNSCCSCSSFQTLDVSKGVKPMEGWLQFSPFSSRALRKGMNKGKNLEWRLIFQLIKFVHSQKVGIIWGCIFSNSPACSRSPSLAHTYPSVHRQCSWKPAISWSSTSMSRSNPPSLKVSVEEHHLANFSTGLFFKWPFKVSLVS